MKARLFVVLVLFSTWVGSAFAIPSHSEAVRVALKDFLVRLEAERKQEWAYSKFVSDIQNYSIGVSSGKDIYAVAFVLKKTPVKINGGGGVYYLDKNTLRIIRFRGNS